MRKQEIKVGGLYSAKVSGKLTTVRVEAIRSTTVNHRTGRTGTLYTVKNLATGRTTQFRSAQKFIAAAPTPNGQPNQPNPVAKPANNQPATPSEAPTGLQGLAGRLASATSSRPPHVVIEALAGTGKTTTLVEGLKTVFGLGTSITPSPQQKAVWDEMAKSRGAQSVCFVAFNKSIADELERRVPEGCEAMTMHRMGFRAVTAAFGRVNKNDYRVIDITADLVGMDGREFMRKEFELSRAVEKLVGLCKINMIDADGMAAAGDVSELEDALDHLTSYYELELNGSRERAYELVPKVLQRCRDVQRDMKLDFNDMIWLPAALGLPVRKYDLLLVDECQDLNRCQQALAMMAGRRLVFCGDRHQAIYGFAGADARSVARLEEQLTNTVEGCIVLPLTVTRRCGKAIVEEAKQIVPEFEAHENNCDGRVLRSKYNGTDKPAFPMHEIDEEGEVQHDKPIPGSEAWGYHNFVQDGDMILCRVNAPLVSQCFRFLRMGRKANIQGRDVAKGLTSTINKIGKDIMTDGTTSAFLEITQRLELWLQAEEKKELAKRFPSEGKLISLQDRCDCLTVFINKAMEDYEQLVKTLKEQGREATLQPSSVALLIEASINAVFTDERQSYGIKLSTIHKAKGLEADRVFLIEPAGATVPHPMAKSDWQREQEFNLRYVAITRAIKELVYVK